VRLRKDHCTGHPRVIAEHGVDHFCAAPIVLATLPQSPAAAGRWAALGARTDRVVPAASWRPEVHRFDSAGVLLFVDERASWMALEALQTFGAAGYGAASVAAVCCATRSSFPSDSEQTRFGASSSDGIF
jgi:hypothetical protein